MESSRRRLAVIMVVVGSDERCARDGNGRSADHGIRVFSSEPHQQITISTSKQITHFPHYGGDSPKFFFGVLKTISQYLQWFLDSIRCELRLILSILILYRNILRVRARPCSSSMHNSEKVFPNSFESRTFSSVSRPSVSRTSSISKLYR